MSAHKCLYLQPFSHENPISTLHKQLSTKVRKEAGWISPYALPSSSLKTKKNNVFNSLFPSFTSLRDQIVCCGKVGNRYCCLSVKVMFWIEVVWYFACLTQSHMCCNISTWFRWRSSERGMRRAVWRSPRSWRASSAGRWSNRLLWLWCTGSHAMGDASR